MYPSLPKGVSSRLQTIALPPCSWTQMCKRQRVEALHKTMWGDFSRNYPNKHLKVAFAKAFWFSRQRYHFKTLIWMIHTQQTRGNPWIHWIFHCSQQGGSCALMFVSREAQGGLKESNVLSPELIFRQCYLFFHKYFYFYISAFPRKLWE